MYVNAGTIGAEIHLPFGGTKDTGNGHREAGQAALDVFTEWKSIYVDYSGQLQRAQIDTEDVVEYRQLGDSDLRVSEICLGTWTTFGGSLADDAAHELVDVAFELGINFFDTANVYSEGRSEEVLGRALASRPRDSYVVATKVFGDGARRRPRPLARADPQADRRVARAARHGLRRPLPVPLRSTTTCRSRRRSAR